MESVVYLVFHFRYSKVHASVASCPTLGNLPNCLPVNTSPKDQRIYPMYTDT